MEKILITGGTGNVGRGVAELLTNEQGIRVLSRQPEKLTNFPNAEIVKGDYADSDSLDIAFKDVSIAFIVSAYAEPGKRALLHKNAIDAAVKAGTKHIIYLSSRGLRHPVNFLCQGTITRPNNLFGPAD